MPKSQRTINLSFPFNFSIRVVGNFDFDPEEIKILAETYLPGVEIVPVLDEASCIIEYHPSSKKRMEGEGKITRLYDDWGGRISLDLWHLLYSIARKCYIYQDLYPIHAACIGQEEQILLVGHSGVGKSTLLLKLLNDTNWQVFSGNKTVISFNGDKLTGVAGNKSISLKESNFQRYPNLISKSVSYSDRTTYVLDQKHLSTKKTVPIKAIYLVNLNDGVSEQTELAFPSSMHILYPYILDVVNADTIVCGGHAIYSGEIPDEAKGLLISHLAKSLKNIKVFRLSGSPDFIVQSIKNQFDHAS